MVDVGQKQITERIAEAQAIVVLGREVMQHFQDGELNSKKGPVFQTAIIAGIMAAKRTHELIPMCHPLALNHCNIDISQLDDSRIIVKSRVSIEGKTGVEMEALQAVSSAALTVYDMCKSFHKAIVIEEIKLLSKSGGKSDYISD